MVWKRAAVLLAALALGGCGDEEHPQEDEVNRVVREFAAADDRRACDLLTNEARERVYGREGESAYDNCTRRSRDFEGESIDISETDISDDGTKATVRASAGGEDRRYRVTLRNVFGDWLVDEIVQQ